MIKKALNTLGNGFLGMAVFQVCDYCIYPIIEDKSNGVLKIGKGVIAPAAMLFLGVGCKTLGSLDMLGKE